MTPTIEVFFDFASPYSYLALTQLRQIDAALVLRPMEILKVMEQVGNVPTTVTCKAKGIYARADLGRWAMRYGVPLDPSDMRANDRAAMLRAVLAADAEQAEVVTMVLYRAVWGEARTLADTSAVLTALTDAGIATAGIAARIDMPEIAAQLAANTDEAAARGVFGSPTMFVNGVMFFGNDRLEFVRDELARLEQAA